MKTSPHPQQSFMSEQLEAWVLDDFRDLSLFRKILRINPSRPSGAEEPTRFDRTDQLGRNSGAALSPLIVGYLRDLTGSFDTALLYASTLLAIGIVLLFVVRRPSS